MIRNGFSLAFFLALFLLFSFQCFSQSLPTPEQWERAKQLILELEKRWSESEANWKKIEKIFEQREKALIEREASLKTREESLQRLTAFSENLKTSWDSLVAEAKRRELEGNVKAAIAFIVALPAGYGIRALTAK